MSSEPLVELAQQDPTVDDNGTVLDVQLDGVAEPLKAQHDHVAAGVRSGRRDEPGVGPLGDDPRAVLRTEPQGRGDLRGGRRPRDAARHSPAVAPTALVARAVTRAGDRAALTERRDKGGNQRVGHGDIVPATSLRVDVRL